MNATQQTVKSIVKDFETNLLDILIEGWLNNEGRSEDNEWEKPKDWDKRRDSTLPILIEEKQYRNLDMEGL